MATKALGFVQLFRDSALALSVLRVVVHQDCVAKQYRYKYHYSKEIRPLPSSLPFSETTYFVCVLA